MAARRRDGAYSDLAADIRKTVHRILSLADRRAHRNRPDRCANKPGQQNFRYDEVSEGASPDQARLNNDGDDGPSSESLSLRHRARDVSSADTLQCESVSDSLVDNTP